MFSIANKAANVPVLWEDMWLQEASTGALLWTGNNSKWVPCHRTASENKELQELSCSEGQNYQKMAELWPRRQPLRGQQCHKMVELWPTVSAVWRARTTVPENAATVLATRRLRTTAKWHDCELWWWCQPRTGTKTATKWWNCDDNVSQTLV